MRDKSIKIRLTELEDKFIDERAKELSITRSEYVRRLIVQAIEEQKNT